MEKKKQIKTLIVCYSYHHQNTLKIANAMASSLGAKLIMPGDIHYVDLDEYDLIGFGSGIDSGKHYKQLIISAEKLNVESHKSCFIFSTSGVQGERKVMKDHATLRAILISKGYTVVDEFSCKGFNTNSFLKYFGEMNKHKPDKNDVKNAEDFARNLVGRI